MRNSHSRRPGTEHDPLFTPAPNRRISAGSVTLFIISSVFVFGGFWVMSLAFSYEDIAIWLFGGGIILDALGLWMAFGLAPRLTKK